MPKQSICERERSHLEKMNKFLLPNKFKTIGYYIAFGGFGLMILIKFIEEPLWVKPILRKVLLLGMLMVSISKDKIEDEFIETLRSQSYRLAFIMAVLYSLIQPVINYVVGLFFDKKEEFNDFSYFEVLFFMLIIQLLFFWQFKRFNK